MFRRNFKSKTFWTGLAALIGAAGAVTTGEATVGQGLSVGVPALLAMLLRDGIEKAKVDG